VSGVALYPAFATLKALSKLPQPSLVAGHVSVLMERRYAYMLVQLGIAALEPAEENPHLFAESELVEPGSSAAVAVVEAVAAAAVVVQAWAGLGRTCRPAAEDFGKRKLRPGSRLAVVVGKSVENTGLMGQLGWVVDQSSNSGPVAEAVG